MSDTTNPDVSRAVAMPVSAFRERTQRHVAANSATQADRHRRASRVAWGYSDGRSHPVPAEGAAADRAYSETVRGLTSSSSLTGHGTYCAASQARPNAAGRRAGTQARRSVPFRMARTNAAISAV